MANIERTINIVDAVCDCIPVVSCFTNVAQLLAKLAVKIDRKLNPNSGARKPSWRDDFKIHIINKPVYESLLGMVPVYGNWINFILHMSLGLRSELEHAIEKGDIEVIKLHLARHPLMNSQNNKDILTLAAKDGKLEVLQLILNSHAWDFNSLNRVLDARHRKWFDDKKLNLVADYLLSHFDALDESQAISLKDTFLGFVKEGRPEIANKLLNALPPSDLGRYEEILLKHTYRSFRACSYKDGLLTRDQLQGIINRCTPATHERLEEYRKKVRIEAENLAKDVDYINARNRQYQSNGTQLDREKIVGGYLEIQNEIMKKLAQDHTE